MTARDCIRQAYDTPEDGNAQVYATIAVAEALLEQTEAWIARNELVDARGEPSGPPPAVEIGWARLELMGRQIEYGHVSEVPIAGRRFLRIEVPSGSAGPATTHYYSPGAVYGIHPISEADVRSAVDPDVEELPF